MKKGQIEMMGLVIIVILIVIGGLFYLRFGILGKRSNIEVSNTQNIQAINLINALMNTQICGNETVKQTIIACSNGKEIGCSTDPCNYLEQNLVTIIDLATDFNYKLFITKNDVTIKEIGTCSQGITSPKYTFTDQGSVYESHFMLCK